ncbi:putative gamma-glutamyltranspeptidase [Pelagophyceae sp. CCMP2097]|nr:putative gamma-glutamyltranspeptidase [Pelagophyceae sp. CCMP2097]
MSIEFASRRAPVYGMRGMVASSQPLASEAGMRVLQQGGTAADACVAAAAALAVTEPCQTGIGGDAFALYYDAATKQVECLQGCGRSPAGLTLAAVRAHPEMQTDTLKSGEALPPASALCVTVPGTAMAWDDAVRRWGKLPLAQVLAPAVELAEEGFPMAGSSARLFANQADLLRSAAKGAPTPFLPNDAAPLPGDIFRNPDLGRTIRRVGELGALEGFYKGEVADAVVAAVQSRGGVLQPEDLAEHASAFVQPASVSYRGRVRVWECPPPTQGITALMALQLLENVDMPPPLSAAAVHAQAEALRFAFADTLQFCADPAAAGVPPLESMLSADRAKARWAALFDAQRARVGVEPESALGAAACAQTLRAGPDTVYLNAVDKWGNACSFIQSNYAGFGTGIVPDGCGFTLQNRGHNFILREGHANCVAGRKFCFHTIIPGMLTDEQSGDLVAAFGVMGGFMQPQGHVQVVSALVDHGLDPQATLDLPRFIIDGVSSELGPECLAEPRLGVEDGVPADTLKALEQLGHAAQLVRGWDRDMFGRGQIIKRNAKTGVLCGGTDPRADGAVLAW